MNKSDKRVRAWLLCLLMILALFPAQVWAIDPIDLDRKTSMVVTYEYDGIKLAGATFELYRVADMDRFAALSPCGDFTGSGQMLRELENTEEWDALAQKLTDYVQKNDNIQPLRTGTVGKDGTCRFGNLSVGLYLVVGNAWKSGKTTYTCNPFLVCLPYRVDNAEIWTYDNVTVKPKAGEPATEPTPPDEPPYLPNTGVLWWPVPILLSAGLLFVLGGLVRKKENAE